MPDKISARVNYADKFRCIGPDCEDSCCKEWSVAVDREAYAKFEVLPESPLRELILSSIDIKGEPQDGNASSAASPFAIIRMNEQHLCPMLSAEKLCRVQSAYGVELLPRACDVYPRVYRYVEGVEEVALTLSCPEAARLVLLDRNLLREENNAVDALELPTAAGTERDLRAWFWPIRQAMFSLIRNRAYPLWQRIFLLGIFCRRLDEIAAGEIDASIRDFIAGFQMTLTDGQLRGAMEALPTDGPGQLDVVLRLAGMLLRRSHRGPRFQECVEAFTSGIGNGPGATLESLSRHYAQMHDAYYAPFFERHPHILENFLINTIVRRQFPFGRDGMASNEPLNFSREFVTLVAQFTLMKGLLIGVSGFHGEKFSEAHVVHTMQTASRHFEHHTEFLTMAHDLLVESRMDGPMSIAILLRNSASPSASATTHPARMREMELPQSDSAELGTAQG